MRRKRVCQTCDMWRSLQLPLEVTSCVMADHLLSSSPRLWPEEPAEGPPGTPPWRFLCGLHTQDSPAETVDRWRNSKGVMGVGEVTWPPSAAEGCVVVGVAWPQAPDWGLRVTGKYSDDCVEVTWFNSSAMVFSFLLTMMGMPSHSCTRTCASLAKHVMVDLGHFCWWDRTEGRSQAMRTRSSKTWK